jgi:hypothetical protein
VPRFLTFQGSLFLAISPYVLKALDLDYLLCGFHPSTHAGSRYCVIVAASRIASICRDAGWRRVMSAGVPSRFRLFEFPVVLLRRVAGERTMRLDSIAPIRLSISTTSLFG